MNVMEHVQILFLLWALQSTSSLCEKYPGGSLLTCYLIEVKKHDPKSFAILRVNETSAKRPTSSYFNAYSCQASKWNSPQTAHITLEAVAVPNAPQRLSLQVSVAFADTVEEATITCQDTDIVDGSRVGAQYKLDGTYRCDGIGKPDLIFSGTHRIHRSVGSGATTAKSGRKPNLKEKLDEERESLETKEIPVHEIMCSNGVLPPDVKMDHSQTLGAVCTISNDKYHDKIGRIFLINSTGGIDCLPCCIDFYWNDTAKQCQPCKPGTTQPLPGFWDTCEVIRNPIRGQEPITATFVSSTALSASSSDNTTEAPSMTPVSAGKPEAKSRSPVLPPSNLSVVEAGLFDANITWSKVSEAETEIVTRYKIFVTCDTWKAPRVYETESSAAEIHLLGLDPGMTCYVKVMAGNSNGYGPESDILTFNTINEGEAPRDLENSEDGVEELVAKASAEGEGFDYEEMKKKLNIFYVFFCIGSPLVIAFICGTCFVYDKTYRL